MQTSKKTIAKAIFWTLVIIGNLFYLIDSNDELREEIADLIPKNSVLIDNNPEPGSKNLSTDSEPPEVQEGVWQQDCSVLVTYDFNTHYILPETISHEIADPGDTLSISSSSSTWGLMATYRNENKLYFIECEDTDDDDISVQVTSLQFEAFTGGTLNYDVIFASDRGSGVETGTFSIDTNNIDANGRFIVVFFLWYGYEYSASTWDHSTEMQDQIIALDQFATSGAFAWQEIRIDLLTYDQNDITSNIRSEYRVAESPDFIDWRLMVPNHEYQNEITIELPDNIDTNNIQVNPSCTTTLSGNTLTLTDTIPTVGSSYEIRSNYKYSKRYAANLKFVNNFEVVSFESPSWHNDWYDREDRWDSEELNSTIVHEGAYSLRLSYQGAAKSPYLAVREDSSLDDGNYFVSFAYYVERWIDTPSYTDEFRFRWWFDTGWDEIVLDHSEQNCWLTVFHYFSIDGKQDPGNANLQFYWYALSDTIFFLDNLRIYKVKPEIQNLDYQKLTISGSLKSWVRPEILIKVPNSPLQVQLRDRNANSLIKSWSVTTDSKGNWERNFSSSIAQKEYELRCFSYDSNLGDFALKEIEDAWDWYESESEGWTNQDGAAATWTYKEGNAICDITGTTANYKRYRSPTGLSIDASIYDEVIIRIWCDNYVQSPRVGFQDDGYNWVLSYVSISTETWSTIHENLNSAWTGTESRIDLILRENEGNYEGNEQWKIDHIKLVGFTSGFYQFYYFTPQQPEDFPYYYSTSQENQEWDFSEQTVEGWVAQKASSTLENGYIKLTPDGTSNYAHIKQTISIDDSTFSRVIIRIYANIPDYGLRIVDASSSHKVLQSGLTGSVWHIVDSSCLGFDLTGEIKVQVRETGEPTLTSSDWFMYDIIRFAHRDSPNLNVESNFAAMTSTNNSLIYNYQIDNKDIGHCTDLEPFLLAETLGQHSVNVTPFADLDRISNRVFMSGTMLSDSYFKNVSDLGWIWLSIEPFSKSLSAYTNWGNCTIQIYDNSSLISTTNEGETYGIGFDLATPGLHNITILANATSQIIAAFTSYQVATSATHNVYFSYYDQLGIGYPWETWRLFLNGSRHYEPYLNNVVNGSVYEVTARDGFNLLLYNQTWTITNSTEIAIQVPLHEILFWNNGTVAVELELERNDIVGVNVSIAPNTGKLIRLVEGSYIFRIYYYQNAPDQYETQINPDLYTYSRTLLTYGTLTTSMQFPPVDVGVPQDKVETKESKPWWDNPYIIFIAGAMAAGLIGGLTWFLIRNFFLKPAIIKHSDRLGIDKRDIY